jgi:hypothetical protein
VAPLRLGGLRGKKSTPRDWLGGTGEGSTVGKKERQGPRDVNRGTDINQGSQKGKSYLLGVLMSEGALMHTVAFFPILVYVIDRAFIQTGQYINCIFPYFGLPMVVYRCSYSLCAFSLLVLNIVVASCWFVEWRRRVNCVC